MQQGADIYCAAPCCLASNDAESQERQQLIVLTVEDRQLALMNFSIEAGILLRGNGVLTVEHSVFLELFQT